MSKAYFEYETVVVNHYLQRLYYTYIQNSIYEKILHYLVLGAIVIILAHIFVIFVHHDVLYMYVKILEPFVYLILGVELLKEAAIARNYKHFFHKHWIDIVILAILSSSMLFVAYIGFMKIPNFEGIKLAMEETKHVRAILATMK
ncbi:MAG: hypothetical protein LAT82_05215 [Nanoarchaeota archaeon]|nr:hypothetical protein [Nanoarchaeota archaeon]